MFSFCCQSLVPLRCPTSNAAPWHTHEPQSTASQLQLAACAHVSSALQKVQWCTFVSHTTTWTVPQLLQRITSAGCAPKTRLSMLKLGRPRQPCWLWLPSASASSCLHVKRISALVQERQQAPAQPTGFGGQARLQSMAIPDSSQMPVPTNHRARELTVWCTPSRFRFKLRCCVVFMTIQYTPDMLKRQALVSEVQAQIPKGAQYYTIPLHQAVPAADWALHSG